MNFSVFCLVSWSVLKRLFFLLNISLLLDGTSSLSITLPHSTHSSERNETFSPSTPTFCKLGAEECSLNEQCSMHQEFLESNVRIGVCECVSDYHRTSEGMCLPMTGSPAPVSKLTVSAGDNKELQLPENSITLSAFALPEPSPGEDYHYEWTPVSQPQGSEESATMQGKNSDTLTLSKLIAGLYRLKVEVTGNNKFGEAFINVTVIPPKRQNQPPVAVITPASQQVKSENTFILDGSDSRDDDAIASYHWEEVSGPLQEHGIDDDTPTLTLKDMAPGNYVFRLTVTDTDGATDSTSANVTVVKETDYPPKANAGSDVIIYLPQKSVTLCGNGSTDDKGIATYEWVKKSDSLTADMTGVRTVCLQLNNLELGDYTFTLNVVDTGGNSDSADVHVYVKPETNQPPQARTQGEMTVLLPADSLPLDGRNSSDEKEIAAFSWTQIGGPTSLTLVHPDQAVSVATGEIITGDYEFKLTVRDDKGQSSSNTLTIHARINENHAPVAQAGGDKIVNLPVIMVTLDGSSSYDDHRIVSFLWQRDGESLAAGEVVNNSDHLAVLQLVNLVTGRYLFTLTVTDEDGLSSIDTASLVVQNGENYKDLIELVLDTDIHHFTQEDLNSVVNQLELLLQQSSHTDTTIHVQSTQLEPAHGQVRVMFYVLQSNGSTVNGTEMAQLLQTRLESYMLLSYPVVSIDTVVCQHRCSGHGACDQRTRTCHCEPFWMPNLVQLFRYRHTNCEWSMIYFFVVCFVVVVSLVISVWTTVHCCRSKRCRLKSKKRHRYSLISGSDDDDDDGEEIEMLPKGRNKHSSVVVSESEFSSEEETLFASRKSANNRSSSSNGTIISNHRSSKLDT